MNVVQNAWHLKYFGNFCANKNIEFTLKQGEVHALLGENGAGKSHPDEHLYGLYADDEGTDSHQRGRGSHVQPQRGHSHGNIGMVHQHFMLIPQLTVTQNIFLGMDKETGIVHHIKELDKKVQELNDRFGFNVNPQSLIWQIPVGVQQQGGRSPRS